MVKNSSPHVLLRTNFMIALARLREIPSQYHSQFSSQHQSLHQSPLSLPKASLFSYQRSNHKHSSFTAFQLSMRQLHSGLLYIYLPIMALPISANQQQLSLKDWHSLGRKKPLSCCCCFAQSHTAGAGCVSFLFRRLIIFELLKISQTNYHQHHWQVVLMIVSALKVPVLPKRIINLKLLFKVKLNNDCQTLCVR